MNSNAIHLTLNWIKKAENDLKIGKRELEAEAPATDMVRFHLQQALRNTPYR